MADMKEVIEALERANMRLTSLGANNTNFCTDAIKIVNVYMQQLEESKKQIDWWKSEECARGFEVGLAKEQLTQTQQALDRAVEALKPFARVGVLPSVVRHSDAGLWSYNVGDCESIRITAKDCINAKAALTSIKE